MEWLAAREVHISGGIRVLSYGGSCNFLYPGDMTGEKKAIQIQTYTSLFSDIRRLGLEVVGCDFFTGPHSHARPEWRIKSSLAQTGSHGIKVEIGPLLRMVHSRRAIASFMT